MQSHETEFPGYSPVTRRVSADRNDPGYTALAVKLKVVVNGEHNRMVVTADPAEGWALCYATDDADQIVFDSFGDPIFETIRGDVRVYAPVGTFQ